MANIVVGLVVRARNSHSVNSGTRQDLGWVPCTRQPTEWNCSASQSSTSVLDVRTISRGSAGL